MEQLTSTTTIDYGSADQVRRLSAWERASFGLARLVASFLLVILSLRGLYAFGQAMGTLEWAINYKKRRRFAQALDRLLGRRSTFAERRRHGRAYFARLRCDKIFCLILDRLPRERAASLLTIENRPLLDGALQRGRGAYIALSHHGPHHVCAMLMALCGYKVAGVRDRNEGGLRRFLAERHARFFPDITPIRMLFADAFPRDIYRCFQDGYVLGSAMDVSKTRHPNQRVEAVEFLGETRNFVTGPLRVAHRCGATVFQGAISSEAGFRYKLVLESVLIDPENPAPEDAAVSHAARQYAVRAQAQMKELPSQITRV